MDWYGPTSSWPRHGRDYFRSALSYARSAGWWFGKFDGHPFGKAVCDHELPADSRCEFLIFSSGSDSETAAHELRALVDRCPHKSRPRGRVTAVEAAIALLDEADLLVQAAERCINSDNIKSAADDLLDLAAGAADSATEALSEDEARLDRAVDLEAASRNERDEATGLADAAGYPSERPVEADPLLGAAGERVGTAERRLGPRSNTGRQRSEARRRAAELRTRIQIVRDQLGS